MQVIARPNESIDSLYKRFKRAVEREGVLADLRKHEYFEKPSIKRKRKSAAARKRERETAKKIKVEKVRMINFKFNADKTQRIPTQPRKDSMRRPLNRRPRKD